ncbi:MAG TPA: hypothetical protein VGI10_12535 [Polyangiaceae bacterium]|jgi:hypothetical protein
MANYYIKSQSVSVATLKSTGVALDKPTNGTTLVTTPTINIVAEKTGEVQIVSVWSDA